MHPSSQAPRIFHVVDDLTPGAAQRAVLAQVLRHDRARWRPHLVSLERRTGADLCARCDLEGLPVHRLRHPRERGSLAWFRLADLVRRLKPAFVHTHMAAAGVVGRSVARVLGVRGLVASLHDAVPGQGDDPFGTLARETLGWCARVVAGSAAAEAAVLRRDGGLDVLRVDDGAEIDGDAMRAARRRAARAALGWGEVEVVVGAAGRFEAEARVDVLVHAFALAASERERLRLLLVGDGPDLERLHDLVAATGLGERVVIVGEAADVSSCLAAADLFAAPSPREALGYAALEAFAAAVPVLAARSRGLPDFVTDGIDGRLLPEGEPVAWAGALRELAAADEPRLAMGRAALARASGTTAERTARALEALYEEVGGSRLARAA